ncbi:MAG: hypothetical protein ABSH41_26200 [Syntrophobacteraceae bacterium]
MSWYLGNAKRVTEWIRVERSLIADTHYKGMLECGHIVIRQEGDILPETAICDVCLCKGGDYRGL